eukprot:gnl/MRDRNA2_/MRDRNA2_184627_c0_seq1.p2 gnl/MRDRNA2_/MRDRNA2_184627_c0~~gnl/MRDRNA2_/MRDRNA2_184627_c0_seq1.p2  ORF type:complete len:123 (+),score=18.59 gnl/MRDRNA2_/MRDRNA2_184627_c0_seq1:308-676(+)
MVGPLIKKQNESQSNATFGSQGDSKSHTAMSAIGSQDKSKSDTTVIPTFDGNQDESHGDVDMPSSPKCGGHAEDEDDSKLTSEALRRHQLSHASEVTHARSSKTKAYHADRRGRHSAVEAES